MKIIKSYHNNDSLVIEHEKRHDEDFSGSKLRQFVAIGTIFERCDFRRMTIEQACFGGGLEDSYYFDCIFDQSTINARAPGSAAFERCSFAETSFSELRCLNIEFVKCVFSGRIEKGYFNGEVSKDARERLGRSKNRFSGNDFSQAKLVDVGFRTGVDLLDQRLPAGNGYLFIRDPESVIEKMRLDAGAHSSKKKESIELLIELMRLDIDAGQKELFMNTSALSPELFQALELVKRLASDN